jgi:hypothetical protein
MFALILFKLLLVSDVQVTIAADRNPYPPGGDAPAAQVDVDMRLRPHLGLLSWHVPRGPTPVAHFRDPFGPRHSTATEDYWRLLDEDDLETPGDVTTRALEPDWGGLGRDTAFFVGYQAVIAGVLYLLPESVSKWTAEQRKTSMSQWWENVQHPVWDEDNWYVNYLGHPYFGAIAYVRARERRFGAFGGFWYAALLSGLYEFGIEALFERPSYQDLIVTPVGGLLIGALLFEPIRKHIQGKPQWQWYDHLTLAVTDPLGTANGLLERSLGLEAELRLQFHPLTLAPHMPFDEPNGRTLNRPREQHRPAAGIGITISFGGKKRSTPYLR